jgi:protein phosphatase
MTHPGKVRPNNEDHFLVTRFGRFLESLHTNLPADQVPSNFVDDAFGMVIADGLGGHAAGERASMLAITTLVNLVLMTPDWILRADDPAMADEIMKRTSERFEKIRDTLTEEAANNPELFGYGTTMTLAASTGKDLFVANIGDSRAYILHEGKLNQLTRDHTFINVLQDAGILEEAEAASHRLRHVLTRCLGTTPEAKPDVQKLTLQNGDRLLLCTDGLNEMVSSDAIEAILSDVGTSAAICNRLIDEALRGGGRDNVTVIVAQYSIEADQPRT